MTETTSSFSGDGLPRSPSATPEPLEQRVRRLEEVVAELQDTRHLEERVLDRLSEQVVRQSAGPSYRESPGLVVEAGRRLLPAAASFLARETSSPPLARPASRPSWFLADVVGEIKDIIRMFVDPRYRVNWTARWLPLAALVLIGISGIFVGSVVLIGPLLDRFMEILLALVAYKALSREAARYREALAPPTGS